MAVLLPSLLKFPTESFVIRTNSAVFLTPSQNTTFTESFQELSLALSEYVRNF